MKIIKRWNLLLFMLICILFMSNTAQAESGINAERIFGSNRYETALKITGRFYDKETDSVILATGKNFPDALAASTLSKQAKAPILLVDGDKGRLPDELGKAINKVNAKKVYLLGGPSAISKSIENQLDEMGLQTIRMGGSNRYESAVLINQEVLGEEKTIDNLILASGKDFVDALSASYLIQNDHSIILLNEKNGLTKENKEFIQDKDINRIILVGGKNVLNDKVEKDIKQYAKETVRIAGANRFETARKIAEFLPVKNNMVFYASAYSFPDALLVGSLSSEYNAPILLGSKKSDSPESLAFIKAHGINKIYLIGGEGVLHNPSQKKSQPAKKTEKVQGNFEKAQVVRVVDGDTIVVNRGRGQEKVRFILVNTPETVHPTKSVEFYGKEASDFTNKQLSGKTIYLEKDVSETDRYGRLLRYVWLDIPKERKEVRTKCFNAILLANGFAQVATFPPDIKYQKEFMAIQNEAMKKEIGLWGQHPESEKPNIGKKYDNETINKDNGRLLAYLYANGRIIGNKRSMIYHMPNGQSYKKVSYKNAVFFNSEKEAKAAGYRKAKR